MAVKKDTTIAYICDIRPKTKKRKNRRTYPTKKRN